MLDMIAGLEWVRDNVAAFGGDPGAVTIAGQSAGGTAVLALLSSPRAQGLFSRVIAHSAAALSSTIDRAEAIGRDFARRAGVEPTRAGWSVLGEDAVLDLQAEQMSYSGADGMTPAASVRATLASVGIPLPFVPLVGDAVVPFATTDALVAGVGADKDLLIGTVAHEFTMASLPFAKAWAAFDPVATLTEAGLAPDVAAAYVAGHPELRTTAEICGQIGTDVSFRVPTIACADSRPLRTWTYDFRWISPVAGLSFHCLDLPFTWDVLSAEAVAASTGPNPPQELATEMHAAWVRFVRDGDPGWPAWDGHNARVFGAAQADHYAISRLLTTSG
jgi:para-nitrobenzyl esterase